MSEYITIKYRELERFKHNPYLAALLKRNIELAKKMLPADKQLKLF